MLKIFTSISQLNTDQLLSVYKQSNSENGRRVYRELETTEQIRLAEEAFLSYLREDFFAIHGSFCAVWVSDGAYKSVLRMEPYKDGLLLTALETAPEARRKGYAFALLTHSLEYAQTLGYKYIYSHVEKRNIASLGSHYKCGFRRVADSAVYIDGTVTQKSCTLRYEYGK